MTAPRPEIQRWTEDIDGTNMCLYDEGSWVNYDDHLRAVTLAKIEAWEEMRSMFNGPSLQVIIREKIAALRKELEG